MHNSLAAAPAINGNQLCACAENAMMGSLGLIVASEQKVPVGHEERGIFPA